MQISMVLLPERAEALHPGVLLPTALPCSRAASRRRAPQMGLGLDQSILRPASMAVSMSPVSLFMKRVRRVPSGSPAARAASNSWRVPGHRASTCGIREHWSLMGLGGRQAGRQA